MRKEQSPHLQALSFLEQVVARARLSKNPRLPTVTVLARDAGVARATMWKAVGKFKQNGTLTAGPRRGIELVEKPESKSPSLDISGATHGSSPAELLADIAKSYSVDPETMSKIIEGIRSNGSWTALSGQGSKNAEAAANLKPNSSKAPKSVEQPPKWERTAACIESDILKGVYRFGNILPLGKELIECYSVCYRTLQKALALLVKRQVLVPFRHSYRVTFAAKKRSSNTIMIVACRSSKNLDFSQRRESLFRAVETESSRIGVRLNIVFYHKVDDDQAFPENRKSLPSIISGAQDNILGFILLTIGMPPRTATTILTDLARFSKPISVLDPSASIEIPDSIVLQKRVRAFSVGYKDISGFLVGQHLLNLGHRKIAYISPIHQELWSRNRLLGLQRAFGVAGLQDSVRAFTSNRSSHFITFAGNPIDISPKTHGVIDALGAFLEGSPSCRSITPWALSQIHSLFEEPVNTLIMQSFIHTHSSPLFEKALAEPSITAWVAANDLVAFEALSSLEKHGKNVPASLSLVGFDDGRIASLARISSYNFNDASVVHAMLAHILSEGTIARGEKSSQVCEEIEGFINTRDSVAPAELLP